MSNLHPLLQEHMQRAGVDGQMLNPAVTARCMCSWRSGCKLDIACELLAQIARASAQIALSRAVGANQSQQLTASVVRSQSTHLAREERFEVPWRSKPPAARPPTWASQARFGGPAQPRGYPEASYR